MKEFFEEIIDAVAFLSIMLLVMDIIERIFE